MTEFTEQIREESKNYVVVFDYPIKKRESIQNIKRIEGGDIVGYNL
jgi:hypothetical protein